jgi:hypothetical protein
MDRSHRPRFPDLRFADEDGSRSPAADAARLSGG